MDSLKNTSETDLRKNIREAVEKLSRLTTNMTAMDKQIDICNNSNNELKNRGLKSEPLQIPDLVPA